MSFFYVYVLKSLKEEFIYVGFTHDLKRRLVEHNNQENLSTQHYAPFDLIHYEAYRNEKMLKEERNILKQLKEKQL